VQTVTYPLDLVRRRMQVRALAAAGAPALGGTWAALRGIARSAGWRGLFSGLSINYMKVRITGFRV
jgi:Mitochondrial carrier protein